MYNSFTSWSNLGGGGGGVDGTRFLAGAAGAGEGGSGGRTGTPVLITPRGRDPPNPLICGFGLSPGVSVLSSIVDESNTSCNG